MLKIGRKNMGKIIRKRLKILGKIVQKYMEKDIGTLGKRHYDAWKNTRKNAGLQK